MQGTQPTTSVVANDNNSNSVHSYKLHSDSESDEEGDEQGAVYNNDDELEPEEV